MPRLTEDQRKEIRRLYAKRDLRGGWSIGRLAQAFNVRRETIKKHVEDLHPGSKRGFFGA